MKDTLILTPTLGNRLSIIKTIDSVKLIGGDRVRHVIITKQDRIESLRLMIGSNIEIIAEPPSCNTIYKSLNYGFYTFGRNYKYFAYINDDDYWLPDYSRLFNNLDTDKTLMMTYGRVHFINDNGDIIKQQSCSNQFNSFLGLFYHGVILFTQQATLIRSEVYYEIGGFDENLKLVSDTKFWIELSFKSIHFKYCNAYCAAYTLQDNQLSSNKELQKNEHETLLSLYRQQNKFKDTLNFILFRILNINIYLKRIYK